MGDIKWTRRFFTIWTGQAFSLMGTSLVQFALIWWLTIETGSALVLTMASIMGILPQVLLSPFAGVMVDRWNRKRTMIAADGLTALATLVLMLSFWLGTEEIWQIYLVLLVRSAFSAFHWPAMQASTSLMVPEEHLARISGLNESLRGLSSIAAPPLGAVLIAAMPMFMVLSVDVLTAAIAIIALLAVGIPEVHRAEAQSEVSLWGDIKEALAYMRSWRGAVAVTFIFMLVNFLIGPAFALLPLLTLVHFGGDAMEYATLESMFGIGMLAGGLFLGFWGGTKRKIITCMGATGACGIGVAAIGLLPPEGFIICVLCCLVIGAFLSLINGTIVAMIQKGIRADMQGRVFSLLGSGVAAMSPVGLLLAGPISAAFGIQPWFLMGGLVMIAVSVFSFFVPLIMRMEDREVEIVPLKPA